MAYRIVKTKGAKTGVFVRSDDCEVYKPTAVSRGNCDCVVSVGFYDSADPSSLCTYALCFHVSASSLEQVRKSALEVVYYLVENFGIPEEFIVLIFNGAGNVPEDDTSVSTPAEIVILVPPVVFGGHPTPLMPALNYALARELHDGGVENIDLDVYIQEHFVPLPNSINTATDGYVIQLTTREFIYLDGHRIAELSREPRPDDLMVLPQEVPEAVEWFDETLAEFEKKQHRQDELREVIERQGWEVSPCIRRMLWLEAEQGTVLEACRLVAGTFSFLNSNEAEIRYHIQRLARRNGITDFQDHERLRRITRFGFENPWLFECHHPLLSRFCPGPCYISSLIKEYNNPRLF